MSGNLQQYSEPHIHQYPLPECERLRGLEAAPYVDEGTDSPTLLSITTKLFAADGVYHNTPATDLFLDRRKPSYLGGFLEMANSRLYGFWGGLTEGLTSAARTRSACS